MHYQPRVSVLQGLLPYVRVRVSILAHQTAAVIYGRMERQRKPSQQAVLETIPFKLPMRQDAAQPQP